MPAHFGLAQRSYAENWMLVEEIDAPVLDTMIRHAGWHFMYLQGFCMRSGVGLTRDNAIHRALGRALKGLSIEFNAAELESVEVSTYPVFQIATVTVQPRHLQENTSLEMTVEDYPRTLSAR
jgi:hypothetical protein